MYRENLGGLCCTCNDCGYMVFGDIGVMISAYVINESLKVKKIRFHYYNMKVLNC